MRLFNRWRVVRRSGVRSNRIRRNPRKRGPRASGEQAGIISTPSWRIARPNCVRRTRPTPRYPLPRAQASRGQAPVRQHPPATALASGAGDACPAPAPSSPTRHAEGSASPTCSCASPRARAGRSCGSASRFVPLLLWITVHGTHHVSWQVRPVWSIGGLRQPLEEAHPPRFEHSAHAGDSGQLRTRQMGRM